MYHIYQNQINKQQLIDWHCIKYEHRDNEKAARIDCSLVVEIRNNYTVPSSAT
jgi:hypothetical protein